MKESDYNQLREKSWRGKLTPAEQTDLRAWLAAHPEACADWDAELGLSETLARLPNAPVPTNFTARVLQAIELETQAEERQRKPRRRFSWHSFLPRAAIAMVVAGLGVFMMREHQEHERAKLVQSVAAFSNVASLPSPEILQDFEAIRQMNQTQPDKDLIALMQ